MTVHVVARFRALPDRVEAAKAAFLELLEPTRREDGCIRYELLQNEEDPTDFTFSEEWRDGAALDAHLQTAHVAATRAKVGEHLAGEADIRRYSLLG